MARKIHKDYDLDDLCEIERKSLTQRLEERKSADAENTTYMPDERRRLFNRIANAMMILGVLILLTIGLVVLVL